MEVKVAWRWLLIGGLPLAAVVAWLPPAAQEAAYAVLAGIGSGAAFVRTRSGPGRPLPWLLLALGLAAGALCSAAWSVCFLIGAPPSGFSVIDAVYFTMYGLIASAICVHSNGRGSALAGIAEAGVVTFTGVLLGWFLLYDPLINDPGNWGTADAALAYPLLDLLLICAVVRLFAVLDRIATANVLVLCAVVVQSIADTVYFVSVHQGGTWSGPGASAAGWVLFFALLAAAIMHPDVPEPGRGRAASGWRAGVLYTALVVVNPIVTAVAFLTDIRRRELDTLDVVLPMAVVAAVGVLLVVRLAYTQHRLVRLALRDELTGLPNRVDLELRLAGAPLGILLVLDLDDFKHVNDSLGHPAGDALLSSVADRLRDTVGGRDWLGRLGGDEFAILSAGAGTELCDRVLAVLRSPIEVQGHRLHVTGSIGVRPILGAADAAGALVDADLALYAAKDAGKDRAVVFEATLRDAQQRRVTTVNRLRAALGTDEITVHYQPIVSLSPGRVEAVEALVRWFPPGGDPIPPDAFVPAAEDSGLIVPLGERVLREACTAAAPWHRRHGTSVTVNVSPRQLREPDFADVVRRALLDSGLPAAALILEITEGVLIGPDITHLGELRRDGVRVAVDDFGTGYSSLAYLRDLPIDILKIDRSFLRSAPGEPGAQALIKAIVDMARSLGLATVAEGVETAAQAGMLRDLGCDKGQGWHYGRPAPADRVTALLGAAVVPGLPVESR